MEEKYMANLKNITDLPVAESAEGLNLIVNDNGAAKQIAAGAVGAQADWTETDETSPAFIKNKPVEEWDLDLKIDITWNTETSEQNDPVFTANEGYSFETFVAKIEAGEIPKVKIVVNAAFSETQTIVEFVNQPVISKITEGENIHYLISWFGTINIGPEIVTLIPDGNFMFQAL
jgi:hypothetical protein